MPYHVRITSESDPAHDEIKLDLSEGELEARILQPYRSGMPITLGGRTFPLSDIRRLRINFTDEESSVLRPVIEAREREKQERSSVVMLGGPSMNWYIAASGQDVTDDVITGPPGSKQPSVAPHQSVDDPDPRVVMVVHGRNLSVRDSMFSFLESLGLHPLDWAEARSLTGKPTPYVGEILDAAFANAQAVVVLFTPDDEAQLLPLYRQPSDPPHETELTPQARPNVLFEAGMAMGRHPDRTLLVEFGKLRPFSDVGGRHTVRMSNSSQDRQELANRLKDAGCPVNLVSTEWVRVGDFDLPK
ncbi:MAG: nucleotide-binding protein [Actinomycetota bacterium]|nr:nucleotide-binding protein [Actinomycetota bacterium]